MSGTPRSMTLAATAGPSVAPDGPTPRLANVIVRARSTTLACSASTGAAKRRIQASSVPEERARAVTDSPARSRCWISLGVRREAPSPLTTSRLVGSAAGSAPGSSASRSFAFATESAASRAFLRTASSVSSVIT